MLERLSRLPVGVRTIVMGIVNVTPDSFSDGGTFHGPTQAVAHALELLEDGADIIDIGGESSRPGSQPISESEELDRVLPVISALRPATDAPLCIDTWKPVVAAAAAAAGIDMVNTIRGVPVAADMLDMAAGHDLGLVLMHMRGTPATMQDSPVYSDLMEEIAAGLEASAQRACASGLSQQYIWLDPGIGFGKTVVDNLEILRRLPLLRRSGHPVLVGTSRKSFLGVLTGRDVTERLAGTLSSIAMAIAHGADIVRVHDVRQAVDAVRVCDAILRQERLGDRS